ncbi:MAG TPA: acyl-CoA carboxylase epsilon subunit [Acidimicrobiia bacterium]|nr:acyl-CoA carboxylase epsilon subunit [Acidimicrobiia bacterium]
MANPRPPVLRSITPDASPEEVAAILAAIACCTPSRPGPPADPDTLHEWVRTSRLRAHRSGVRRGPWRFSGRMPRRNRA